MYQNDTFGNEEIRKGIDDMHVKGVVCTKGESANPSVSDDIGSETSLILAEMPESLLQGD